jgi:iron complex transport system ATP-binding protein
MTDATSTPAATTRDDPPTPAVALDGVTVRRHDREGRQIVLLDGVDWRVQPGEHWAVLGPNGAGKSTMLQLAGGVTHPTEGTVDVLGHRIGRVDMRALRERIGHVDAATARGLKRGLDGRGVVLSGAFGSLAPQGRRLGPEHEARADALLALTGSEALAVRRFDDCSQGERQRLLLARALMAGEEAPALLLLDEPASGLDLPSRERLVGALVDSAHRWPTLPTITVTHHLEEIPPTTTHALLLREGRVVAQGQAGKVLTSDPVSECFGLGVAVEQAGGRWAARLANT